MRCSRAFSPFVPSSARLLSKYLPLKDPAWWGTERRSCHEIFLKERPQRLHRGLIKGRKKAGERRGMRQVRSPEERHERSSKRREPLRKRLEGSFPAHCIAHEHHDKINHLVVPHTSTSKAHPLLNGFQEAQLGEHMSHDSHFAQPRGGGWNGVWGYLDMN